MRTLLALILTLGCGSPALAQTATAQQKAQIAPTGMLRAALVKIPFLAKQDANGSL
jgi:hypothetical protein